jgi:CheY-like chemotaxis protein
MLSNSPYTKTESFAFFHSLSPDKPLDILLVEDVTSDALLIRLALNSANMPYTLRTLRKGDEVLPWLTQGCRQADQSLPDVIMLDLGLPCLDGFEVLEELAHAELAVRAVPIVIMTGYGDFEYLRTSYNLCVPAYITKPCDPRKLREVLVGIRRARTVALRAN